jgi:hypothetical protein
MTPETKTSGLIPLLLIIEAIKSNTDSQ